ncbi:Zn(II)2Cys6 transcription factor domain-containing protein [Aspergillus alliaceus]|uniref:Zn(II)2Cys6 transcription factor domain-containing protein n=1 Tax=Petromyces alliaceus TaxID=209559 RepID=UPI0012A4D507|nr:uncharacterized protein BDW43DRAFT_238201 [Aspergillus alliaceus]KAB8227772.1 hypothetical protein BDW43DRAFT_238201 [Aspergillus alliaceus]
MSSGTLQGQKSLFRVALYQPSGATGSEEARKAYHARRSHRKSRAGCVKCKQRRVKCDETKPHCLRCQKHGVDCSYDAGQANAARSKSVVSYFIDKVPSLTEQESAALSMSLIAVSAKIDELLQIKSQSGRLSDRVRALHHFHEATTPSISSERSQNVMRGKMIRLAFDSPFLMHSIIGAATSHLRRIYPEDPSYTMVEAYHWQRAIKQYSEEISTSVGPHNMDPLYSACLLMTIHSFGLEEYNPRSSFVFSDDPDALNWLMLQSGLRHLLELTVPWLTQSIWWGVFKQSREGNPLYDDHRPGRVGLHPGLADICGIDDTTTEETNPYHWPLRMLTPLLSLERNSKTFTQYTNFMGRLLPDFYEQLLKKDPPALIILSWWLSLVLAVDVWWMETRAKSECVAICMYLEESRDPRILRLLEFPAETCGYLLKHVQEQIACQYDLVVL